MTAAKKIEKYQDQMIQVTNCSSEHLLEVAKVANQKMIYKLFQSECEVEDEKVLCFGIEIVCRLFDEVETAKIPDITTKYEVAKELFDILCENLVTPVCMKDIVEDFLVEKYSFNWKR